MTYFLGEIVVTHRKLFIGWVPHTHLMTTMLIEADDWLTAKVKFNNWASERMKNVKDRYRYEVFVSNPIR